MKLIDEKGKLFGKLNLIDLLVVLILVAALVFVGVRFLGRRAGENPAVATTKLTYTVGVNSVDQTTYNEVVRQLENAGGRDQLMANGEMVDAYVTGVTAVPHVNFSPDAQGNVVRSVEDFEGGRLDLTFTVEAQVPNPTVNLVGTQEVRVAKTHILKTTHFEFPYTTIMTCDWG